ncbi:tellurite resistance TerB family protein [Halomonas sp. SSL-5]|uniref:tellurite resistance TerB family protein n=1 Tax=Halomonas sp. SSL-5 TaxID=3065855 RepID=UPI0027393471|nr:tellurite resistance TerB family protein [Halomonas sp. SSL-5]MDY7115562.1 tellurite resistance TerB family protein [Halomonas sp. SSL-5]
MNASKILQQLMQQAGGQSGSGSSGQGGSGLDIQGMLGSLSRQLGGGGSSSGQGGGSGVDVKSLLGGGALGMLVGSKRGRKLGGKALKYGAIAGVGMLAWKAWQNSRDNAGDNAGSQGRGSASEGEAVEQLGGQALERRSLELLQAMIMAARADGHIDAQERELIAGQIDALGADQELHAWVERQLQAPLDAEALAAQVDSPQAAREMYLISVAVVDEQNGMERAWLDQLGRALALPDGVTAELEHQAREAG